MPTAIAIRQVEGKPGQVYYPLEKISLPDKPPKPSQVVVKVTAAALNHRDLFIRQHLYPGTSFGIPLLSDACGIVIQTGSDSAAKAWQGKRVILNPGLGWKDDPEAPESPKGYAILGGTKHNPDGTLQETITIDASELEPAPEHLSSYEAAALPLTGLTAWRAVMTKSQQAKPGRNILVTGIGGGVAIMATLFAVGAGANVYVSSGSEEKIEKAKKLGAKGGVNYKEKDWDKKLLGMLPKDRPFLDAIIDGAGGDAIERAVKIVRPGGVVAVYGMTVSPKMNFVMGAVLKHLDVRGCTMGSRKEFAEMVKFVKEKGLKPVVSRTVTGLDNIEAIDGLFEDMKKGSQFGKLVIELSKDGEKSSKL